MSRLLIRNGRVIDPSQSLDQGMDVLVEDGVISALEERVDASSKTPVVDASGLVVAPGFIDLRASLGEPGFEQRETIVTGARAAAAGGFTAVCVMPDTDPVNDDPAVTRFIRERGLEAAAARIYPVGAVTAGRRGEALAEMGEMQREGAVACSDGSRPIANAQLMRRALEYARSFHLTVAVHEEDIDLSAGGAMHEGPVATRIGLHGIPAAAEEVMVARDIFLTELTGARVHLAHLSTRGSLALVRTAKRKGISLSCEVGPAHFCLTDLDLESSTYHPNWKLNPPLRSIEDVEAVRQGIYDGTVDAIVSDHSPRHADEKELDFADAPAGAVGLETTVSLAIDRLIHARVIGLTQLVRLLSTAPAEIFGLPGGSLKVGSPADLTLLNLRRQLTVDPSRFLSRSRNTPFAGMKLKGGPAVTIVGGKVVWKAR